uniref:Uncharacterized protein n=1 Tax=Romanomermis culicivorax TaxID=13658 RepID=A0A915KP55_ROMCU
MKILISLILLFNCAYCTVTVATEVTTRKLSSTDSKKQLMMITKLINDLMKRDDRKIRILLSKNRRKLSTLGKVVDENGILATDTGHLYSKIAHQLDHSASLINEIIQRRMLMNKQLEHLATIQKYMNAL